MKNFLWMAVLCGVAACGDDDGQVMVDSGHDAATHDAADTDAGDTDAGDTDAATADADVDGAVTMCAMFDARTTDCTTCMRSNCCDEITTCGADQGCTDLVECLRTCDSAGDPAACTSACVGTHGLSSAYNPLLLCGASSCDTECPFASP